VGHALEVLEAIDFLTGRAREPRLLEITLALAAEMLACVGIEKDLDQARSKASAALASGKAADVFARMVAALGGPVDILEGAARHLEAAPIQGDVLPDRPGYVAAMDTRVIGLVLIELGGGRRRVEDGIDHRVGLSAVRPVGSPVGQGVPICRLHAASEASFARAAASIRTNQGCGRPGDSGPTIIERIVL
jgi:thymidine phosphorylase